VGRGIKGRFALTASAGFLGDRGFAQFLAAAGQSKSWSGSDAHQTEANNKSY